MPNSLTEVKPIPSKQYIIKNSKLEISDSIPFRSIVLAPSTSGKTTLLVHLILNVYRGCFSRIYIFSPTVNSDSAWKPVKDYIKKDLNQNDKKERCYFEEYKHDEMEKVINDHKAVVEFLKQKKDNDKMYSILIIIDDMADNPQFTRNSKLLHALYTRGRHFYINTIISSQVLTTISPIIRKNLSSLYIFKLSNNKEIEYVCEEYSGLSNGKKNMLKIYELATKEKYSFLFINLKTQSFYIKFDKQILINDE